MLQYKNICDVASNLQCQETKWILNTLNEVPPREVATTGLKDVLPTLHKLAIFERQGNLDLYIIGDPSE